MAELQTWGLVRVDVRHFEQLQFELTSLCSADALTGEVLWSTILSTGSTAWVGLAFPWAAIAPGVLVVQDMLQIATNALLLDNAGEVVRQDAAYLASVVYRLSWQTEVLKWLPS